MLMQEITVPQRRLPQEAHPCGSGGGDTHLVHLILFFLVKISGFRAYPVLGQFTAAQQISTEAG